MEFDPPPSLPQEIMSPLMFSSGGSFLGCMLITCAGFSCLFAAGEGNIDAAFKYHIPKDKPPITLATTTIGNNADDASSN